MKKQVLKKIYKISAVTLAIYFVLCTSLYYLMGEQLHIRESRGNLSFLTQELYSLELTKNNYVEQKFESSIEQITSFSVSMGTYGRENNADIAIELYDETDSKLLHSEVINTSQIQDSQHFVINLKDPIEGTFKHMLSIKLRGINGEVGQSVSPIVGQSKNSSLGTLYYNGETILGSSLCYQIKGIDRIWTGIHYKEIVGIGALIIIVFFGVLGVRILQGKKSHLLSSFQTIKRYKYLIKLLVSRDFKTKYKRSILGVLWSFLNPMLTMMIQYFVFSNLFESDIENFQIYLLIGIVSFSFFSEACGMALSSITGNASLITKVYIPRYIYPCVRVLSSLVNFAFSTVPLFIMIIISEVPFSRSFILILFPILCLFIFSLGIGMLLSSLMVFFRDIQFLWGVISMIWMYATPVFYPVTIVEEKYRFLFNYNPLYHFVSFIRTCILEGISPEPRTYVVCLLFAVGSLIAGIFVFNKTQDRFIYYL